MIKINGKLQQPNSGRATNNIDPLGMKVLITSSGKYHDHMVFYFYIFEEPPYYFP